MMRRTALVLLAALLVGCGARVAVEADAPARRAGWKTWAWLQRPPPARGDTELAAIDERVRAAFEREMRTRGFRLVERERPDFLVTYYAAVFEAIEPAALEYAAGGASPARTAVDSTGRYEQGLLIFDVLAAEDGRLAWRGVSRRVFDSKQTREERNERIADAVAAAVSQLAQR